LGYDRFGGRREYFDSTGYKDSFWWDTIELGCILSYKPSRYQFGCGFKINHNIAVIQRYSMDDGEVKGQENYSDEFSLPLFVGQYF
jgi:hypothetical protein